jgi:homoserine O-succinyltransferase
MSAALNTYRFGFRRKSLLLRNGALRPKPAAAVSVGLINNMPDAELKNTEGQFRALLAGASALAGVRARLRIFAIPQVPRSAAGRDYVQSRYEDVERLWTSGIDALIVTGMEPKSPLLQDEPYWDVFARLVSWAAEHTHAAIWSCLAAHACVLELDGIRRQRFDKKLFGVFQCETACPHQTFYGSRPERLVPHSRYNGLPESDLVKCGYQVWSRSPRTGPDCFVKPQHSLFVFLQGHPEYDSEALLREYKRDIGRYLRGRSARYPELPCNYFTETAAQALLAFRKCAFADRDEGLLSSFPNLGVSSVLHSWRESADAFYAQWLKAVAQRCAPSRTAQAPSHPRAGEQLLAAHG